MPYVVAEPCIGCKFTDCVEVCPVDCFRAGPNFLVIDPDDCINCGACEPCCPTSAIFADRDLPERWQDYVGLNAELAKRWPSVTHKKPPMPDAEHWRGVKEKRAALDLG